MNDDIKKDLRTQGKYRDIGQKKEKRPKESPVLREKSEKKAYSQNRNSSGKKNENVLADESENESPIKYEENSNYSFQELQDVKPPVEIVQEGEKILSETENGTSKILYYPSFFPDDIGSCYLNDLRNNIDWDERNIVIHGVEYPQPRLVAWYGPFPYSYSGVILEPAEMPKDVLEIKKKVEDFLREKDIDVTFNSVLLNYYRNGKDSVAWHSDDELSMGVCPTIASVSLGATRKFEMKRKIQSLNEDDSDMYLVHLSHGSLLIMTGVMQLDWLHRVPKEYHHRNMRINLTFRSVYPLDNSPKASAKGFRKVENHPKNTSLGKLDYADENMFDVADFPQLSSSAKKSVCLEPEVKDHDNSQNSESSSKICNRLDESENPDTLSSQNPNENLLINNLNHDGKDLKCDIPNKNVHCCDNSYNNEESIGKNDSHNNSYSTTDDNMDDSTDSTQNSSQTNIFNNNQSTSGSQQLNVNAAEFVPINAIILPYENNEFDSHTLAELLCVDFDQFEGNTLKNYTSALKRAGEEIADFSKFEFEQLKFLSEISDGSQTDKNQRLITHQIHKLLNKRSGYRRNCPPRYSHSRQRPHDYNNEYRDFKRYPRQNRDNRSYEDERVDRKGNRSHRY